MKYYDTVILGAGLAGLSAGCVLTRAGKTICVVEKDSSVGGLARTVEHRGFRFDLGGHRFIAQNNKTEQFVLDVLDHNALIVPRSSKIYLRNKFIDYPLKPANALLGLGLKTTIHVLADYAATLARNVVAPRRPVSLEEWVVNKFGRAMFDLYFREYSEKVWGMPCSRISKDWAARRIDGLSLGEAIKNAFSGRNTKQIKSLADSFLYPLRGIGDIAERLRKDIERENIVLTDTSVVRINHDGHTITSVMTKTGQHLHDRQADDYIASIPLTQLVSMLRPAAPPAVVEAAARLAFRDLVIVTIMLDREQVTDLTWMYFPEKNIPFGRIHEPKNWSPLMAPKGKTHIVAEYFCFAGDPVWSASDTELAAMTVDTLSNMGFISAREVIDSSVLRVPKAYPLFDVDYARHCDVITGYLERFRNLHLSGRSGMFRYYNMDHAIESGIGAAERIRNRRPSSQAVEPVLVEA